MFPSGSWARRQPVCETPHEKSFVQAHFIDVAFSVTAMLSLRERDHVPMGAIGQVEFVLQSVSAARTQVGIGRLSLPLSRSYSLSDLRPGRSTQPIPCAHVRAVAPCLHLCRPVLPLSFSQGHASGRLPQLTHKNPNWRLSQRPYGAMDEQRTCGHELARPFVPDGSLPIASSRIIGSPKEIQLSFQSQEVSFSQPSCFLVRTL